MSGGVECLVAALGAVEDPAVFADGADEDDVEFGVGYCELGGEAVDLGCRCLCGE